MAEKIRAVSMSRYRGGAAERRLYGGQGTITEFWIYFGDDPEPVKMRGHGATPGQRKTDAIERAKALRLASSVGARLGLPKQTGYECEHGVPCEPIAGGPRTSCPQCPTDPRAVKYRPTYAKTKTMSNPPVLTHSQSKRRVAELRRRGCKIRYAKLPNGDTAVLKKCPEGAEDNPLEDVAPDAGPVAWFAIGVLAVAGGVIWYATRPGEAKAAPTVPGVPAPAKKCASYDAVAKFAKNIGYNVWYVEAQAVATWQPAKPAYSSDPKARAYSQVDCSFFKWTGTAWVADDATNAELAAWVKSSTVGHPVSAFLP